MKKWAAILAVARAFWMVLVLESGSLRLAMLSNYPGTFAARWVQFRGIAPSRALIWAFNAWLVLTSAIEWVVVGLALRAALRRGYFRGAGAVNAKIIAVGTGKFPRDELATHDADLCWASCAEVVGRLKRQQIAGTA